MNLDHYGIGNHEDAVYYANWDYYDTEEEKVKLKEYLDLWCYFLHKEMTLQFIEKRYIDRPIGMPMSNGMFDPPIPNKRGTLALKVAYKKKEGEW